MRNDTKRWLILMAGICANLCQGAAYSSSIFASPMLKHLGLMTTLPSGEIAPNMMKWVLVMSINLALLPVGMLACGRIADRKGPKLVILIGGLIFGSGMFLASFANSLLTFVLTFAVMMGFGSGCAYGGIVSTAVRWFPDHKGLASGMAVAALGFGPAVIAPAAMRLMAAAPNQNTAVLFAFKVLGIAFLIIMCVAGLTMSSPPKGYKPEGFNAKDESSKSNALELNWTEMVARPKFWLLFAIYACGAFSGLMVIVYASPIAQSMAKLSKEAAAGVVMIIALANACGRVSWGYIADKVGRMVAVSLMLSITAVAMMLLPSFSHSKPTLIMAIVPIGFCFGGCLGTFPSICADYFGSKNMAVNYALMFCAVGLASIAGPYVGASIKASTGSYSQAFVIASAVATLGLVLSIAVIIIRKRRLKAAA